MGYRPKERKGGWSRPLEGSKDVLVIGIDFGTTYCGVAWATAADFDREKVNFITSWPGDGREEGKAPTELFYEDDQVIWGFEIPSDVEPIRWFKLLLLKDEDLTPEIRESEFLLRARKALRKLGKTPVDVIADYLRALWKHIQHTITKSRGKAVLNALSFHVVLTVPAIWKQYARQDMEKAAKQAGILDRRMAGPTKLSFAPEPEAAALSTLFERGEELKERDVYIICDAGGGTVDLITYEIESIDPIRMREAVEGTGGLCGGIFIDEAFEELCKTRLGRRWDHLSQAGIKDIMKGEWEHSIKPQFTPENTQKEYIVAVPAEAFGGKGLDDLQKEPLIKKGRIHFKGTHLQPAFSGIFSKILALINAQKKKTMDQGLNVTGIILVGGLGGSPYLYNYLSDQIAGNVNVLQASGMGPRTAICHGAVFKGFLDGASSEANGSGENPAAKLIQITSTISRASFGILYNPRFEKKKHLELDKYWDEDWGEYLARDQMNWYLKKGECVSTKNPVTHSYARIFEQNWDGRYSEEICQCEDAEPPNRKTSSVTRIGTFACSILEQYGAGSALRDHKTSAGIKKRFDYNLEMVPTGATVDFAVICNGKRVGNTTLNVCSDN